MKATAPTELLLEYTQDKLAVVDESGTYTYVNAAAERLLGFDREALLGTNAFDYVHPADRSSVLADFESVVGTTSSFAAETATYRHRTADGDWVWLESRLSNLTDQQLEGYVVSSREVTDRIEAERERAATDQRLRELADTTDDVLWMFDGDWSELLFCNPAYEAVYGRPIGDLEADPTEFLECIYPPDRPAVEAAMDRLAAGEQVDVEYRTNPERDYGTWVWVQGQPIVEDGEVVRIVGFSRDVTDRRRRERQLVVLDNFLRHNIRNSLNVVNGSAEALETHADDDVAHRARLIRRAGEGLLRTAEKQREITRVISEQPQVTAADLATVVPEAVRPLRERYPDARIEVIAPDSAVVDGPKELGCAVAELVENGVRHDSSGELQVRVTVEPAGDGVELTVRDTAPPIPEIDRQVLLGDHDMSSVNHSRGLGLWLVYWVVDVAGGTIDHDSDETGNVVTIRLPRPD
ncbi:PAS domain-containing sensor histidine kinase [Haloarcula litorea]|uniref:PAS domain-containing sensor histidine kinase n=1 Tax=Haloarcula litorea TaxID=3032579 RepID=UPI0023E81F40|nr:PAS domain-containing sensor histidine kinase [Halomicroarcula sp. GDY20]